MTGISFEYLPNDPERRVPVLISIDPALFANVPRNDLNAGAAMIAGAAYLTVRGPSAASGDVAGASSAPLAELPAVTPRSDKT